MTGPRHVIFGTAGHVDHGKSSLVLALTGTDPDRLAEEKAREMTIDLGFAFMRLPGMDQDVAFVDVPGHEMFLRNMVAGATGIDAALLVVAADEGVMPQTVEHLDVLRFLDVSAGVIALTKCDKADAARLQEAENEVRALVRGTFLEAAEIVPVSAVTRFGLDRLAASLAALLPGIRPRAAGAGFRMPVDRVFTLKGAGTVVTGTVVSGCLEAGEDVALLPDGRLLRPRTLHVHGASVARIEAGQRAAVNLPGVEKAEVIRGDVLAAPGALAPTWMADARLTLSSGALRPIEQRTRVRIHHGTREVMARVIVLEGDRVLPGETRRVQLRLETPLVAAANDPFVMRSYSPMRVTGGGRLVDPHPPKRKKTSGAEDVARREQLATDEVMIEALDRAGAAGMTLDALQVLAEASAETARAVLEQLARFGRVRGGRRDVWFSAGALEEMQGAITAALAQCHAADPLRRFVSLNDVVGRAAPRAEHREAFRLAVESLRAAGKLAGTGDQAALPGHAPQWADRDARLRDGIISALAAAGLATPSRSALAESLRAPENDVARILDAMRANGDLVRLDPEMLVLKSTYDDCRSTVVAHLTAHGAITVGEARDLLGASRKYLLPFLEQLDKEGVTMRKGEGRVLRFRT